MTNIYIDRLAYRENLKKHFDDFLKGNINMTIVEGQAGVGKTNLVNSMESVYTEKNASIIVAKENQYGEDKLEIVTNIISQIIKHILSLPKGNYEKVVELYYQAMGKSLADILNLCEKGQMIFPYIKKTKNKTIDFEKIIQAYIHFLEISSSLFYPLIIFFDDVQWSDETNIDIINQLSFDEKFKGYIIASYRQEEVLFSLFPQVKQTQKIMLKGFTEDEIIRYLQEYNLHQEIGNNLVPKEIYQLTEGNPLYIRILIEDVLKREEKKDFYSGSSETVRKKIDGIIKNKLSLLDETQFEILMIISAFEGSVSKEIVRMALSREINDTMIQGLTNIGLVSLKEQDLLFSHDIVYQCIYENYFQHQLEKYSYRIIKNLLDNLSNRTEQCDKNVLMRIQKKIVDLSMKLSTREIRTIKEQVGILVYGEALRSKAIGMLDRANKQFQRAVLLINEKKDIDLWIQLQIEYMESLYIGGEIHKAQEKYDFIIDIANEKQIEMLKIVYLRSLMYRSRWKEVLTLGNEILESYGHSLDRFNKYVGIIKFKLKYRNTTIEKIKKQSSRESEFLDKVFEVLLLMFPAANRIAEELFEKIVVKMALLAKDSNNVKYKGIGYACAIFILYHILGDFQNGSKLQDYNIKLIENIADTEEKNIISIVFMGTFTHHLSNKLSDTVALLDSIRYEIPLEYEQTYQKYGTIFGFITKYVMGMNLDELDRLLSEIENRKENKSNYLVKYMCYINRYNIESLKTGKCENLKIEEDIQSFRKTIYLNHHMMEVQRLYLFGKYQEALALAESIKAEVDKHIGFILNDLFYFYHGLAIIENYSVLEEVEKSKSLKVLKKYMNQYEKYKTGNNTVNIVRYWILKGRVAEKIDGNQNVEYYYSAMKVAEKEGSHHQLGLIHQLMAESSNEFNDMKRFHLQKAVENFQAWGADFVAQLNSTAQEEKKVVRNVVENNNSQDIEKALKIIKNASAEETLALMFEDLSNNTNIRKMALIIEEKSQYTIMASCENGEKILKPFININYDMKMKQGLVRYVFRTKTEIIEDDIGAFPLFIDKNLTSVLYVEGVKTQDIQKIYEIISIFMPAFWEKKMVEEKNDNKEENHIHTKFQLTEREQQIAKMLLMGYSNKEISEKAFISEGTVRNYMSKLYEKLEVKNRTEAVIKLKNLLP